MNVLTVTRAYGAGGYEVARRLADALGWELLDRELLHRAAALEHLPDAELERFDEKPVGLVDRFRLHPPHRRYLHGLKEAAVQAAARGNVVLVGRGTGQLLADADGVFHLRLTAPRAWRAARMARQEGWTQEQALARCAEEDRNRDRFTHYFFGDEPSRTWRYDAVFRTDRVPPEDVAASVAALLRGHDAVGAAPPVVTLSRELAADDGSFPRALADRLGLTVCDRDMLEREAVRLGVPEADLAKVDAEVAAPSRHCCEALGRLVSDLADRGGVLIVGRGGNFFLRDRAAAFHVLLAAAPLVRVRRVMAHRWVREDAARRLLDDSDARRRRFCERCFAADWADPLAYDLTVNAGRLGPGAVDLAALAAVRHRGRVS